jgi:hypothetical protein
MPLFDHTLESRDDPPMLLVTDGRELPSDARVWGTGGWLPPDQREALDWLTLARFSGWDVNIARRLPGETAGLDAGTRWVVIACDPDALSEQDVARLASRLVREPIVVVARAASPGTPMARLSNVRRRPDQVAGRWLRWTGPGAGREWRCRSDLTGSALTGAAGTARWLMLEGTPVVMTRSLGRGVVATLGFHPSEWRDGDGAATAAIKHLLVWSALAPVAWLDWEGTLVLRMDDPGGAQNVFSRSWCYPKLTERNWAALGAELCSRQARLSVGYIAGWADDGDPTRGELAVAGRPVRRVAGAVYPSPDVVYRDRTGHAPGTVYDYESEFRGIQALRAAGAGDVELHGYTHLNPDAAAWAASPDRYDEESWYRELGGRAADALAARGADEHPLALGLQAFERHFLTRPTTLICPGDQWTTAALEHALESGLNLVASYYLAIRHRGRFCWAIHVCAPYLDEPRPEWFAAGLPVVGYFHDREPALEGVAWISRHLDAWQAAGASRLIDFRELASAIGRRLSVAHDGRSLHLRVENGGAPDLVRGLPVAVRVADGPVPSILGTTWNGEEILLELEPTGSQSGRVTIPVACEPLAAIERPRAWTRQ